jgi:hypothetical protein
MSPSWLSKIKSWSNITQDKMLMRGQKAKMKRSLGAKARKASIKDADLFEKLNGADCVELFRQYFFHADYSWAALKSI